MPYDQPFKQERDVRRRGEEAYHNRIKTRDLTPIRLRALFETVGLHPLRVKVWEGTLT